MSVLICGSLAFDTITNFPGRFAQQIMPDKVHMLNVSFLVPTMRREYGGCAGNIAYSLHLLGGQPLVMAALGNDGGDYLMRLQDWGLDTSQVLRAGDTYTAQCMIITDEDNNQITAFHPGAMQLAHNTVVPVDRGDITLGIIAPDGRDAMLSHAAQLAAAKIPFVFDPGQGLPMFNGDELLYAMVMDRLAQGTGALAHAADGFGSTTLPRINRVGEDASRAMRQLSRTVVGINDNPQSLLLGNGAGLPGPGEPGFVAPAAP